MNGFHDSQEFIDFDILQYIAVCTCLNGTVYGVFSPVVGKSDDFHLRQLLSEDTNGLDA